MYLQRGKSTTNPRYPHSERTRVSMVQVLLFPGTYVLCEVFVPPSCVSQFGRPPTEMATRALL